MFQNCLYFAHSRSLYDLHGIRLAVLCITKYTNADADGRKRCISSLSCQSRMITLGENTIKYDYKQKFVARNHLTKCKEKNYERDFPSFKDATFLQMLSVLVLGTLTNCMLVLFSLGKLTYKNQT